MERFAHHKKYSVHLKVSLVISEAIVILFFLFSPSISTKKNDMILLDEITASEIIPPTIFQQKPLSSKPPLPEIKFGNLITEDFFFEDVSLQKTENNETVPNLLVSLNKKISPLSNTIPRQILEVLPQPSNGEFHGSITLKLKINEDGKVVDYKILYSNLDCKNCINKVLTAAYQSIWEPALIRGKTAEYWIEKTYNFN